MTFEVEHPPAAHTFALLSRSVPFCGLIFDVVRDEVSMPGGQHARREFVRTLGAVAVVALDDAGRVALVRLHRHPVGRPLWELPAGLLDVTGESPLLAARRELAEEADLTARRWHPLVELHPSPGMSDELIRVYLARDLVPVPDGARHQREHEEAELCVAFVDLDEAVAMALRGEITNATAVAGLLAAAKARDLDWTPLPPAPAP